MVLKDRQHIFNMNMQHFAGHAGIQTTHWDYGKSLRVTVKPVTNLPGCTAGSPHL